MLEANASSIESTSEANRLTELVINQAINLPPMSIPAVITDA
jgi:hypothetical protein